MGSKLVTVAGKIERDGNQRAAPKSCALRLLSVVIGTFQNPLRRDQIGRVEAFREPTIDGLEAGDRVGRLALLTQRLVAARSSQDSACWRCASSSAWWKRLSAVSAAAGTPGVVGQPFTIGRAGPMRYAKRHLVAGSLKRSVVATSRRSLRRRAISIIMKSFQ